MNDDLADVGLEALDALESQDNNETDNQAEEKPQEDNTAEESAESDGQNESNEEDSNEDSEEESKEESEESEPDGNSDKLEKEDEKKELTDEEFEELAKKRGYSKVEDKKESEQSPNKLLERPEEVDEKVWSELPDKNKIVYNSLPYITVEGKDGSINVKTPDQLPEDFEFKNKKAEAKFYNDLQAQEMKANQMIQAIDSHESRVAAEKQRMAEARDIISQIESLQKSGELPTPKAKNGTKEFDTDPAVELINKVLNYRAQRASEGVNLTIKDSLMLYKVMNPEEFEKKEAKGDVERSNIAKKVAGNNKATSGAVNKTNKPEFYRPGMTLDDVVDRVMDDME